MLDLEEVTTLLKYNGIHATSKKLKVKKSVIHQFLKSNGLEYKDGTVQPAVGLSNSESSIINIKNSANQNSQNINKFTNSLNESINSLNRSTNSLNKSINSLNKNKQTVTKLKLVQQATNSKPVQSLESKLDLLNNLDTEKFNLLLNNLDDILEVIYTYKTLKKDFQKQAASTLNKNRK